MSPVVFIGLGGAGTLALQHLRRRFAERRGAAAILPPSSADLWCGRPARAEKAGGTPAPQPRFLALDTDAAALRPPTDSPAALSSGETLHLPLRKPAEYRAASDEILSWLSRRWLYNIPRSLLTEGLRPLGRLAFVDHRVAIAERLRGLLAGPSPRVFIVASIDGGTGGGMLLDVAYAVRQQLDELKLSTDCLCGLLLHATFARGAANDLCKANAYATLTELNHFMLGNAAYRAGPVEVLPAGDVSEPPFHDAYLVDLGEELSDADFDDALGQVAEYLYLNATSGAAALDDFRRVSRTARKTAAGAVPLRSFGLHALRVEKQAIADRESSRLCLGLIQHWLGESADGSPSGAAVQP
ncbi:MAG: tubulin-like doman-containing protein, partial [Pirellulales bacterium]